MTDILGWMLGVAWRLAIIGIGFTVLKSVIRNGKGTLRELLETASLAIRAGCLAARKKLVNKLQKAEEEEETEEIGEIAREIRVEGTVR